jgi:hypothetical protein
VNLLLAIMEPDAGVSPLRKSDVLAAHCRLAGNVRCIPIYPVKLKMTRQP